jgi:hypothetical protein
MLSSPGTYLLSALTGHPTLTSLRLDYNAASSQPERCAAGASLAALAAASGRGAAALRHLSLRSCSLRDFGTAPLIESFAAPTFALISLDLSANGLPSRFVELRLAPALRRCAPLRHLILLDDAGNEFAELRHVLPLRVRGTVCA